MADRKAVNKYIPPDFDPRKHGSINRYRRNRLYPRKHGLPVVRFELPFSVWCGNCGNFIKKATRFNSTKKVVGKYLSLDILEFSCTCKRCKNPILIRTDPENRTYVVSSGGKAKLMHGPEGDPSVDSRIFDETEALRLRDPSNAMARLEHLEGDKSRSRQEQVALVRLKRLRDADWSDPFVSSKNLRRKFRKLKREESVVEARKRVLNSAAFDSDDSASSSSSSDSESRESSRRSNDNVGWMLARERRKREEMELDQIARRELRRRRAVSLVQQRSSSSRETSQETTSRIARKMRRVRIFGRPGSVLVTGKKQRRVRRKISRKLRNALRQSHRKRTSRVSISPERKVKKPKVSVVEPESARLPATKNQNSLTLLGVLYGD